jgi:hypothetical protein
VERRRFWAGAGGEVGTNRWRGSQPGVRRRPPFFVQPGVRRFHRFPMRREAAVRGEPGLPHGRTWRARAGDEVHVVGDPTDGFSWRDTQRADTEVRAPAARDLEYGAVRRFSSIRPRRFGFTRNIPPRPAVFVFFGGALFLCGGPLFSVHKSLPPQPKRWPHRTLNSRAARRNLEYGAVRRFSSIRQRRSGFTKAVPPKSAFFRLCWRSAVPVRGTSFLRSQVATPATKTVAAPYSKHPCRATKFRVRRRPPFFVDQPKAFQFYERPTTETSFFSSLLEERCSCAGDLFSPFTSRYPRNQSGGRTAL